MIFNYMKNEKNKTIQNLFYTTHLVFGLYRLNKETNFYRGYWNFLCMNRSALSIWANMISIFFDLLADWPIPAYHKPTELWLCHKSYNGVPDLMMICWQMPYLHYICSPELSKLFSIHPFFLLDLLTSKLLEYKYLIHITIMLR